MGRMIDICAFVIDRESVEQRRSIANGKSRLRVNQGFEKKILRRIIMAVWMIRDTRI